MIFVTGDCHRDFRKFSTEFFPEQREMTKNDYVIICGDFGGIWDYEKESKEEKYWMDWLDNKPFTTLFVSGNHENFDRLDAYLEKEWHGGKVNEIRPSVLHLRRGEIFDINGKTFFTFGGARSHDIRDGILDPEKDKKKIKEWRHDYSKLFRINKRSWWEQEMPTKEEKTYGLENLKKYGNKVDYIISHCAPQHVVSFFSGGFYKGDELTEYFDTISDAVDFKGWFFGHYHENRKILDKYYLLYEQIIRIC